MRHSIWYILNPAQAIIEFNREEFEAFSVNRSESYEYMQTFDDNNIVEYNTVIVNVIKDRSKTRFETVNELYGIRPQEIRTLVANGQEDYIFRFAKPMSKAGATRIGKILEQLYFWSARFYTLFRYDNRTELEEGSLNIGLINDIGWWLEDGLVVAINDVKNAGALEQAREIDPSLIVQAMRRTEKVDDELWLIIWYGGWITYVLTCLRSVDATYKFFSENFAIDFSDTYESMEEYIRDGVFVSGDGIIRSGWKIKVINDKGDSKDLTDFDITVHYKIHRKDKMSYVVSFIKPDAEVRHIEWPMSLNKTKVAEFVSGFWPYHITASDANLKKIHEMISSSQVPDITVYDKYGKTQYNNDTIVIYKDYVYNVSKNVAIPKLQNTSFYFIDGINGIKVEWRDGVDIDTMLVDKAPSMGNVVARPMNVFFDITKEIFTDASGDLLVMTACAWLGHSLYGGELPCPMFFTTGITGSGKTTYAKFLCAMFGIEKPLSIEGTTPFPLRISLTLLEELPLFLNEFRTKMPGAQEKTSILKSLFDGTAFERGRKDMSIESHKFSAYVFMEGEELPESWATRSRSIIWKVKKSGQGKVIPENLLTQNRETLGSFCYSYYQRASKSRYLAAVEEWYELFHTKGIERRILTNIVLLYAGTMAVAPERKDELIAVCEQVLAVQMEDFSRNGTTAEILNILGKYVGSRYCEVYIDEYYNVVIPWDSVIEFTDRSRITTELKMTSYRDHIESAGISTGMYIVNKYEWDDFRKTKKIMVDGLQIAINKNIDKRFLCNEDIFEAYEKFISLKK